MKRTCFAASSGLRIAGCLMFAIAFGLSLLIGSVTPSFSKWAGVSEWGRLEIGAQLALADGSVSLDEDCNPLGVIAKTKEWMSPEAFWSDQSKKLIDWLDHYRKVLQAYRNTYLKIYKLVPSDVTPEKREELAESGRNLMNVGIEQTSKPTFPR
jgi:hypothetical protein